jgi:hypothetical protein
MWPRDNRALFNWVTKYAWGKYPARYIRTSSLCMSQTLSTLCTSIRTSLTISPLFAQDPPTISLNIPKRRKRDTPFRLHRARRRRFRRYERHREPLRVGNVCWSKSKKVTFQRFTNVIKTIYIFNFYLYKK